MGGLWHAAQVAHQISAIRLRHHPINQYDIGHGRGYFFHRVFSVQRIIGTVALVA